MKTILTFLIIISSFTSFAQIDKVSGDYKLAIETKDNNTLQYELNLSQDGTFTFHYYSNIKNGTPLKQTNTEKENGLSKTM